MNPIAATNTMAIAATASRCKVIFRAMRASLVNPVDAGRDPCCGNAVEVKRHDGRAGPIGHAVYERAFEVAVRELSRTINRSLSVLQPAGRELLLGQLAFRDPEGAPDLMSVHRARLPGQPRDRRDDEPVLRIHIEQVSHVALG